MDPKDLVESLEGKEYHAYYHRTIDICELMYAIVTGTKQEEYVLSYKPRESEYQKEQRYKIYISNTKSVANRALAIFDKVDNSDPAYDIVQFNDLSDDQAQQQVFDIERNQSNFANSQTLKTWLSENYKLYNSIDPNAWIVYSYYVNEFDEIMTTADVIKSENVVDYEYINGELYYLALMDHKMGKGGTILTCYNIYYSDVHYYYVQYIEGKYDYDSLIGVDEQSDDEEFLLNDINQYLQRIGQKTFFVVTYPVIGGRVPAQPIGYNPDAETYNKTYVSVLDPAENKFKQLINVTSEFQLTKNLHTFLQKFQVAEPCQFVDEHKRSCNNGYLGDTICSSCKGTGLKIHTTSQDIVLIKSPEQGEESTYVPLNQRVFYPTLPFDIVNKQDELIDKYSKEVATAIFSVDINERNRPNVTATAIDNFEDSINSVLKKYSLGKSRIYRFATEQIALNKGYAMPVVKYEYGDTFDLLTIAEMFTLLGSARQNGASYAAIESIQDDIIAKQYVNQPTAILLNRIKQKFIPFKGVNDQIIQMTLATMDPYSRFKIQYLYNDIIFDRINAEMDIQDFAEMTLENQQMIVDQQTDIIIAQLKEEANTMTTSEIMRQALEQPTINIVDEDETEEDETIEEDEL